MHTKHSLSKIKTEYKGLTQKEKQLADFILKNPEAAVKMSVSELAQSADVVRSLVIRFCQSLGFSGYTEFRLSLSGELARNVQFNYIPYISPADNSADILDKVFSANIKTLHDTALGINRETLSGAVKLLQAANNIYIYGIGTSAGIVTDFQYRLMQLGFTAFCFTDIASMKVSTLNIKPGDVAFGISNSGRTVATIDTLSLAKAKGAKTICLTGYPDSEITHICDFPLVITSDEIQYPIEAISARIAHISVLDAISISLSATDLEGAVNRQAQTHDLINTIRYGG